MKNKQVDIVRAENARPGFNSRSRFLLCASQLIGKLMINIKKLPFQSTDRTKFTFGKVPRFVYYISKQLF